MKRQISTSILSLLIVFSTFSTISCFKGRKLQDEEVNFFDTAGDNRGKEYCSDIILKYTKMSYFPAINSALQSSRFKSPDFLKFISGEMAEGEYTKGMIAYTIPSICLIIVTLALGSLFVMMFFAVLCCKLPDRMRQSVGMRYFQSICSVALGTVILGLSVANIVYAAALIKRYKQVQCSAALYFDEYLYGPNTDYTNDDIYYWTGLTNIVQIIETNANAIIASADAGMFNDLATFNYAYVKSKDDLFLTYISNYATFFNTAYFGGKYTVFNPYMYNKDGSTRGTNGITIDNVDTVFTLNATTMQSLVTQEKAEYYDDVLKKIPAAQITYNNLNNEPTTNKMENKKNALVNEFNHVIKMMTVLRESTYDVYEQTRPRVITYSIACIICFSISTLGIFTLVIGHILVQFYQSHFMNGMVTVGFLVFLPAYLITLGITIPSIFMAVFYADVCAYMSLKEGFNSPVNPLIKDDFVRNYNSYALIDKVNYFDKFKLQTDLFEDVFNLETNWNFFSNPILMNNLTNFGFPIIGEIYSNLSEITQGNYEIVASQYFLAGSGPFVDAENQSQYCKHSDTISADQPDQIVFNSNDCQIADITNPFVLDPNWIKAEAQTDWFDDGIQDTSQVDLGVRCITIKDYYDSYITGVGNLWNSALANDGAAENYQMAQDIVYVKRYSRAPSTNTNPACDSTKTTYDAKTMNTCCFASKSDFLKIVLKPLYYYAEDVKDKFTLPQTIGTFPTLVDENSYCGSGYDYTTFMNDPKADLLTKGVSKVSIPKDAKRAGYFLMNLYSCLKLAVNQLVIFGNYNGDLKSLLGSTVTTITVELPLDMDTKLLPISYERYYVTMCQQLSPAFFAIYLVILIEFPFVLGLLFLIAYQRRHDLFKRNDIMLKDYD